MTSSARVLEMANVDWSRLSIGNNYKKPRTGKRLAAAQKEVEPIILWLRAARCNS